MELGYNLYGAPLFKKEKDSAQGDFYEYTPEGLLKCAISKGMRYAYEYDAMDRMTRKSASGRTLLALAYDRNGNKISQADVTGKVTEYAYSPLDLLERVWDDGKELAAYTYNPDGTPKAVTHGPIRQEYAYDLDKNLTGLTVHSGDALLARNSYTYDGNGNRTLKRQLGGETLYHYDPLNQLNKVEYPSYTEELFYDRAGNHTRRLVAGEEELYRYDPRNRLMAYTKNGVTTMFQYDNAGNLLVDDKVQYSYDAFNRTVKAEAFDGNVQVNRYDAEGLRYEMEENGRLVRFIFHKGEAVAEQEENSNVIRLIRGSELIARSSDGESARTYYHYASDEMGSTTHIVDENGNVQNRYEYDAWGKIEVKEEAVPNRFTYYGQQIDPITQQYYLRARFYNPVIGRFTQEDTYRGDGLNLYAYCTNNPVYYVDPSGYACDQLSKNAPEKAATTTTELTIYDPKFAKQQMDPVVIKFSPGKLTGDDYKAFVLHLKEQENELNRLSLFHTDDLELNLLLFHTDGTGASRGPVHQRLSAARQYARRYLGGTSADGDVAHALDACAGGYIYNIPYRRPSKPQQMIGSDWSRNWTQIIPGRKHILEAGEENGVS